MCAREWWRKKITEYKHTCLKRKLHPSQKKTITSCGLASTHSMVGLNKDNWQCIMLYAQGQHSPQTKATWHKVTGWNARTTGLRFVLHICILFFFSTLLHPHSMLNKKRWIPPTWLPVQLRLENWGPCAASPVIMVSSARQGSPVTLPACSQYGHCWYKAVVEMQLRGFLVWLFNTGGVYFQLDH